MGVRAYCLAKFSEGIGREAITQTVDELYRLSEVTLAETLVGDADLIIRLESPSSVEEVVARIQKIKGLGEVHTYKVDPVLPRERMTKNITGIPLKSV